MDIKNFINDSRLKGMSDNAIKSALLNMGASQMEVNAALPAFVQPQPQPEIVAPQEVRPQAVVLQAAQPQIAAAQQVQPRAIAPQEAQQQVVAPQEVQPKIAPAQPTQGEADLSRIIKEAQAKTDAISSTKPQTAEPAGTKETIMQNVGTFGTQPTTPSGDLPAVNTVFGNQQATATQPVLEPEPSSGGENKKIIIAGVLAIVILGGGFAYAYTKQILFFAPKISDEQLFAGIPDALSRIDTESYSASIMVESRTRESGVNAYTEVAFPQYDALKDAYARDIKTISVFTEIASAILSYQTNFGRYPQNLADFTKLKMDGYSFSAPITNPNMFYIFKMGFNAQKPYEYELTKQTAAGYGAFTLRAELETQQAADAVLNYYESNKYLNVQASYVNVLLKPDVSGKTVSFSLDRSVRDWLKDEGGREYLHNYPNSSPNTSVSINSNTFYYIPEVMPKPLPMSFADSLKGFSQYLPASLKIALKTYGAVDFSGQKTTDAKSGWAADIALGDFSASVDVDFVKKGSNYYFKVNKAPAIIVDFTSIKRKWVKITPDDLSSGSQGGFFDPSQLVKFASSSAEQKQKAIEQAKLLYALAINDGVLVATPQAGANTDPANSRHFSVALKKENLSRFYKDAVDELNQSYGTDSPISFNDLDAAYLESDSFGNLFDYWKDNNSFDLWIDKTDGFPLKFSYVLRLVPDDSASKLKDTEYVITSNLELTDINKPAPIEEPAGAISYMDAAGLLSGKSTAEIKDAQLRGVDSRRIADLRVTQTALELYYNKNGTYPKGIGAWAALQTSLTGAGIGVPVIPDDPSAPAKHYMYASDSGGTSYVLGATLDSVATSTNTLFKNPLQFPKGQKGTAGFANCSPPVYCLSL